MTLRRAVALAALGLLGCHVGPRVQHFPIANGPEGVAVNLRVGVRRLTATTEVSGELLAVEDTALLVRATSRGLFRVPFRLIQAADFKKVGPAWLGSGRTPSAHQIARLRLVCRFPQGLSPDLLQRLLALNGQSQVQDVPQ